MLSVPMQHVCVFVCVYVYEQLLLSESGMTCRMAVPVKLVGVE